MADGLSPTTREGVHIRFVRGLSLDRVRIEGQIGPAIRIEDSSDVELRSSGSRSADTGELGERGISLVRVAGVVIDGSPVDGGA